MKDVDFVNNVTAALLNEEMTKTKVVDLDEFYNFVVDDFFNWNHLLFQNVVSSLDNFVVDNFIGWDNFVKENYVWISQIWNLNFSNDHGCRNYQNESCRSWKVIKLCSWELFHLTWVGQGNYVWISQI